MRRDPELQAVIDQLQGLPGGRARVIDVAMLPFSKACERFAAGELKEIELMIVARASLTVVLHAGLSKEARRQFDECYHLVEQYLDSLYRADLMRQHGAS